VCRGQQICTAATRQKQLIGLQVPNESDLDLAPLVHSALHRQLLSPAKQNAIKPTDAVLTAISKSQPPLVLEQSL